MKENILNLARLPARLSVQQTSTVLGFSDTDIQILHRTKLLKPLGNPAHNAPKFFAACEISKLASDQEWLSKATRAISSYWQKKNQNRST